MGGPAKRKSKDGLFLRGVIWWCRIGGQRVSTKCRDREAARVARARLEREHADPNYAAQKKATLGMMIADTLTAVRASGRSAATLEVYTAKLGHYARIWGTGLLLNELAGEPGYQRVGNYLKQRTIEGAGPHTQHKELKALRFGLRRMQARGMYAGDVATVTRAREFSPQYKPRDRHLKWEEIPKLLAAFQNDPTLASTAQAPDRARHVAWLIATAGRWAESLKAQLDDHDLVDWTVKIRGTKTAAAARTIPIAAAFTPLLVFALQGAKRGKPLFRPWENVGRSLLRACVRAGVTRVSPNDLRRTNATLLSEQGLSNDTLYKLLGHTSPRMVSAVYRVDSLDAMKGAVGKLKGRAPVRLLPPKGKR